MDTTTINIQINFQQILDAVKQLSPKEKVQLNEVIWQGDYSIPIEHQNLVMDRVTEARLQPDLMLDWEEAQKMLIL